MVAKRSTKLGKIKPYIDVRSTEQVPQFESLLKTGPVIVLVYADWCGHCKRFKQSMWDEVANNSNKTAAVHYDMVDKTSMKNAKIEGYPTLFEVSSAKTPVAIPTPQSKEDLLTLVNSNVKNVNMNNNAKPLTENNMESYRMTSNAAQAAADTFEPQTLDTLPPEAEIETTETNEPTSVQGGGGTRGGSLMESLLKVAADTAHVALLASSAAELNRRFKKHKKTKKRRSSKKHQTRRH